MKWKIPVYIILLTLMILLMVFACSGTLSDMSLTRLPDKKALPLAEKETSEDNAPIKSQDMTEFVAGLVPDGWHLADSVLEFTPENLYEHIDGNAELYLAYNVVKLTFASFINSGNPNEFVDLFIYDMGSARNAFGIFSVERFEGQPPVNLGRMAYRSSGSLFIWKGPYYVQVIGSDDTDDLRRISMDMASKTSAILKDSGEFVWGLTAFPRENLITDSIKFFLSDAMGLNFMTNTYTADYQKNGSRQKVFISRQSSPASAGNIISRYVDYARKYGKGIESLTGDGVEFVACDMGSRYDVVFQKENLACGVLSVKDLPDALKSASNLWKQINTATGDNETGIKVH